MGEFLSGWRRKIGVATLVMALAAMGGWVRSHRTYDAVVCVTGKHTTNYWTSVSGSLIWNRQYTEMEMPGSGLAGEAFQYRTEQLRYDSRNSRIDDAGVNWKLNFCGLRYGEEPYMMGTGFGVGMTTTHLFVPYWIIVVPLTLLSAYLLLSKPRKPIQKKIVETTTADGA